MREIVRHSINGDRPTLEHILGTTGVRGVIKDYPACAALFAEVDRGTAREVEFERELKKHALRSSRMNFFFPTEEELQTCEFFQAGTSGWVFESDDVVAKPVYSSRGACPECGKGRMELTEPLRVDTQKIAHAPLVRMPPALFLASMSVVELAGREQWTGLDFRPVIEQTTGTESNRFRQAVIMSTLPPMHRSGAPIRSPIPRSCERCRRLGYQLPGPQIVYSAEVLKVAKDWNLSQEWTAAHFDSVPSLICSRRVVHSLLKLVPDQVWLPVKFVDE